MISPPEKRRSRKSAKESSASLELDEEGKVKIKQLDDELHEMIKNKMRSKLQKGWECKIRNLHTLAGKKLKGHWCKLMDYDEYKERWNVKLEDGIEKSIRPANLKRLKPGEKETLAEKRRKKAAKEAQRKKGRSPTPEPEPEPIVQQKSDELLATIGFKKLGGKKKIW